MVARGGACRRCGPDVHGDERPQPGSGHAAACSQRLDAEWRSKGIRVHYVGLAPVGKRRMQEYLTKLNVPAPRMTPIDDETELMFVDHDRQGVRQDKILSEERTIATPETGKIFVDVKIDAVVEQIR